MSEVDWMQRGACRNVSPDVMIPDHSAGVRAAKQVCAQCGVTAECLAYALAHNMQGGVWGGKCDDERVEMYKRMTHLHKHQPRRHGTESCYHAGCRLPECREAHAAYNREAERRRNRR